MIAEFIRKEQKSSDSNAEQVIKRWFKGAIDRGGGRKLRAEKWTKTRFCLTLFFLLVLCWCFNINVPSFLLVLYS